MKHTGIFIFFLVGISFFLDYPAMYEQLPAAVHQWRQADGTSMALNYYQNGMDFWKPQVHHQLGGYGYGVGELPVLYYAVAGLYHLFGVDEGIFRLVSWLIFALGLLALSKLILKITGDELLSLVIPFWAWSSPIIAFYAFNFLPNVPALGFAFMGWYAFYFYYKKAKIKWLYWSCLAFLIAGLLKITALLTFVPIMGAYFFELIRVANFKENQRLFPQKWLASIPFVLTVGLTLAWYLFAIQYNEKHTTTYFRTTSWAIWHLDWREIKYIASRLINPWGEHYFHISSHILTGLLLGWIVFTPKKHSRFLYFLTILSSIGGLLYTLIWFYAFKDHDYYVINLVIIPIISAIVGSLYLKNNYQNILRSWWFKFGVVAFLIINLMHTQQTLAIRNDLTSKFAPKLNHAFYEYKEVRAFLKENGIEHPDLVLSLPDKSPNVTLYYMNLPGWTEIYSQEAFTTEKVKKIASYGAKYLI
ncbi:MAG: ArnT family glycosyltransferase, partial [Saprospiraceae bacterium]